MVQSLSVMCMRSKAWLAAPVLLAHAEGTKNIPFFQWVQNVGIPRYWRLAGQSRHCTHTGTYENQKMNAYPTNHTTNMRVSCCVNEDHRRPVARVRVTVHAHIPTLFCKMMMFFSCMMSTAARCSLVCGCGQGSLAAISSSAASMTAAPFNIVAIKMSWPGQSTNETCLQTYRRVPKFWTHRKNTYVFVTSACARRTGAAERVERRRRER